MRCRWSHIVLNNFTKRKKKPKFVARNEIWKYTKIILVTIWPLSTSAERGGGELQCGSTHHVLPARPAHWPRGLSVAGPHTGTPTSPFQPLLLPLENGKGIVVTVIIAADWISNDKAMTNLNILLFWLPCTLFPFYFPCPPAVWFGFGSVWRQLFGRKSVGHSL